MCAPGLTGSYCKHAPWQPIKAHASHVPEPAKLPSADVGVDGVDAQSAPEVLRGDVMAPGVQARHACPLTSVCGCQTDAAMLFVEIIIIYLL